MNRTDFQSLADVRIDEAKTLLDQGKFDGSYYLAGYAVECALKACIAKLTQEHEFPDKKRTLDSYTHAIEELVRVSGLKAERDLAASADPDLADNWQVVKDWKEDSRYARWTADRAQSLYDAITDADHGVLPWLKIHW